MQFALSGAMMFSPILTQFDAEYALPANTNLSMEIA